MTQDGFVTVTGGLALVLVIAGFVVVETRSGPFEHEVEAAQHPVSLDGAYSSSSGEVPGGFSEPCSVAETGCSSARIELDVAFEGLPRLAGSGLYAAFLVGPDRVVPAGPLEPVGSGHELSFAEDVSDEGLERLVVALAIGEAGSQPSELVVLEAQLPDSDGEAVPVEASVDAALGDATGRLAVGQVGVVEVSATARTQIEGLPAAEGWTYRAGFVDEVGEVTPVGALAESDAGYELDERVPQVVLADQDRFVVQLGPETADGDGSSLAGFPVVDVGLETRSVFG